MNDEFLQSAWQKIKAPLQTESILSNPIDDMGVFKKKIRKRNTREVYASIFLIIIFGIYSYFTKNYLAKTGAIIIVLSAIAIIFVLRNRKENQTGDLTLPPVAYLQEYLHYLKKESKLLRTVVYWYILPPMTGYTMFILGDNKDFLHLCIHLTILILTCIGVFYLNQEAVKTEFEPRIKKLEELLKEEEKTLSRDQ